MDGMTMILDRRSVRKYKDKKVDRTIIKNIISTALFAPSWANYQIVRYTVLDDKNSVIQLGKEGVNGFLPNINTINNAAGLIILSVVTGKSGCGPDGNLITSKGSTWEMFDAGIACQTFCLAAYEEGIGTVIMGVFDDEKIANIINLPEDETVVSVIAYGYEDNHPKATKRKSLEEVTRFI